MFLLVICMSSLKKCLFRSSTHFFNWFVFFFLILSCMSCLCILEINPLSFASFANIFFHYEGCLFILLIVSFVVQKLLSLISSHLFIFVFIFITLGGGSKKILLWFMSESVLPMFSSKSFIVSGLTFRSLIQFEFLCMVLGWNTDCFESTRRGKRSVRYFEILFVSENGTLYIRLKF